jgi:hypothetical protein
VCDRLLSAAAWFGILESPLGLTTWLSKWQGGLGSRANLMEANGVLQTLSYVGGWNILLQHSSCWLYLAARAL